MGFDRWEGRFFYEGEGSFMDEVFYYVNGGEFVCVYVVSDVDSDASSLY